MRRSRSRTARLVGRGLVTLALLACAREARAHNEPCAVVDGEDPCFEGEACTAQDGGPGICLPPPCASDAECAAPLDKCAVGRTSPVCVQCRSDADCDAGTVCELDPRLTVSDRCVECRPGAAGACAGSAAGHLCFPQRGVCGCRVDDDCPMGATCHGTTCAPRPAYGDAGSDSGTTPGGAPDAAPPVERFEPAGCAASGERARGDQALAASLGALVATAGGIAGARRHRRRARR